MRNQRGIRDDDDELTALLPFFFILSPSLSQPRPPLSLFTSNTNEQHLYNSFLAHDTLLHYHRALARNDIVAYGPFELASPKEVDEETAVAGMKAVAAAAAAAAASSSSSSTPASASAALPETWDPALPFFKRKASVLMPLAAPRPLQMAVGTSVIKLRLRQSVAVLRRAKVFDDDDDDGNDKQRLSGVEAPLDLIEFRSAPRLWVPGSRDQSLGRTSMLASYEEIVDGDDDGKKKADGGGGVIAAAEEREVPAPVAAELTPLHLSPRRLRSRSASLAGEVAAPNSPPPIRQRVRIDVTATADFNPEGWMATFKRPLESVMLTMVLFFYFRSFFLRVFFFGRRRNSHPLSSSSPSPNKKNKKNSK